MSTLVHSVRLLGSVSVDSDRTDGWALFEGGRPILGKDLNPLRVSVPLRAL